MYKAAIAQLIDSAEMCEHNAPIHEAAGNIEQAEHSARNAMSYRMAIIALERLEQGSLH